MTSDAQVRRLAIDPSRSLVVQAPAGSGKTALLIQRYLALLALVEAPEEILALTFTRKAAEEMRDRVLKALYNADAEAAVGDYERQTQVLARAAVKRGEERGWFLADCPGRLRIQTFDAFCAQIVSQWPAAAGVGVALDMALAPRPLYAEAAMATFDLLGQEGPLGQALTTLLPTLANDIERFVALVSDLLGRREQWLPIVLASASDDLEGARVRLEEAFLEQALDAASRARSLCPDSVLIAMCSYMEAVTGDSEWHPIGLCDREPTALRRWQQLAERLLTAKGEFRKRLSPWPQGLGPVGEFLAMFEGLESLAQALSDVAAWGPCVYSDEQWQRLSALLQILPATSAQLLLVFARHGQWDFTEVMLRALQALGSAEEPTDGALRLDRRLQHILVDEFQDTSVLQYRLLERLTSEWVRGEARSLFVVGDPMQSIYAFRKAEVGLFYKLGREGIGSWPLEMVTLTANFRSDEGLVSWVNKAFATILPPYFDADAGAVPHVAAVAARGPGGGVLVHGLEDADLAVEARYVAQLVGEIRTESPASRIAILVRTRTHGHAIAGALTQCALRFSATDLYSLGSRRLIRDLLALTEALLLPAARLSALSGLRAPWCGLDLADLTVLCEEDRRPLVEILADSSRLALLSTDGQQRARRVRDVLQDAETSRGRLSLVSRVERAWIALEGPAALESEGGLLEAELFFQSLAELERGGEVDLWQFRERLETLYAPPDAEVDDLHILTIHKAKGLEFDVVICPCLGRDGRPDKRPLLLSFEAAAAGTPDLLLAPLKAHDEDRDALYECLWGLSTRKRRNEIGRLLYVACTRARHALHLVGHAKRKGEQLRPAALLSVLWPVIEADFVESLVSLAPPGPGPLFERSVMRPRRLSGAAVYAPAVSLGDLAQSRVPEEEPPVVFDWAGTRIRLVGIAVHAGLAELAMSPLPPEGTSLPDAYGVRAEALLRGYGLHGKESEEARHAVVEALERTLRDPRGRWILSAHHESRVEYALSAFTEEGLATVRVDRSFVDTNGVRWIIDYKTGRHEGSERELFLAREQERYRDQLTGYAQLFQAFDGRPVELGLYFPLLGAFRHWRYQGPE